MAEAINYTLSQWKAIEDIFTKGEYYLTTTLSRGIIGIYHYPEETHFSSEAIRGLKEG